MYRRIPYDPYRDPGFTEVVSPGPGLLLLVDAGNPNSPGWLVRDDGTLTHLTAAVETRSGDARRWHWCGGYDADPAAPTSPVGWCLVDAETDTSYQAEAPWLVDELVHGRPAVSPAEADEPWGLENVTDLVPYWYDGGVLHTRDFGPADATGTVSGMPRGEMAVWSLDPASLVLTVRSSGEGGQSWQVRRIALPSAPSRLSVHRTRSGALIALDSGGELALYAWPPRQIWRADADADSFDVVYVESERTDVAGYDATAFTELALEPAEVKAHHVVPVRPEQVVEIALDGIQRSTRYPGGIALRFARVVRYRDDKSPDEADTLATVKEMFGG
jgi:hypothetical protein